MYLIFRLNHSRFCECLNLECDFQLNASKLFNAFLEESEVASSFPIIADPGLVLAISVDFESGKVASIYCGHESNIAPPNYQHGTVRDLIVNAVVTKDEYDQLQTEVFDAVEECKNEGIVEIDKMCERVLSVIKYFDYDTPAREGKNISAEIDEDTELPTDQGGYELKEPGGRVLLNHLSTDEEVSKLVYSEFGYLLDSVNENALYDFLIHQRNEAIKNHEDF